MYSAIKIRANVPDLYSVLNPDTSSDSPSARSKGVRFVSAKMEITHTRYRGALISITLIVLISVRVLNLIVVINNRGDKMIKAMLISYEMVWAILRRAPNRAYLLLEAHPLNRVEYTFILDTHKNNNTPHFMNVGVELWGYKNHSIKARNSPIIGAAMKGIVFAIAGLFSSLANSLIASANGCGRPLSPTLLGPFRSCTYPRILRSRRVKNAIATRAQIYVTKDASRVVIITGI